MKKLIYCLLIIAICAVSVFALAACNAPVADSLDFGAKYYFYLKNEENNSQIYVKDVYYVFNKNGTGLYHYFESTDYKDENRKDGICNYEISFKYEYLDDEKSAVALFYDGIKFDPTHNKSTDEEDYKDWRRTFTVSTSIIKNLDGGYNCYNLEYIKKNYPNCEITDL